MKEFFTVVVLGFITAMIGLGLFKGSVVKALLFALPVIILGGLIAWG